MATMSPGLHRCRPDVVASGEATTSEWQRCSWPGAERAEQLSASGDLRRSSEGGGLADAGASIRVMRRESDADRAVAALLRRQGGLITRAQVLAAGWTPGTLRHRIRPDGPWRAVLPGIYLGSNGPLAGGQREIAAVLYAGPGCVLTGPAALQQQGMRVRATDMIDVLVAAPVKRQDVDFVRMHRTARMPDQAFVLNGIRWALTARAVADTRANRTRPAGGPGVGGGRGSGRPVHGPATGAGAEDGAEARIGPASVGASRSR